MAQSTRGPGATEGAPKRRRATAKGGLGLLVVLAITVPVAIVGMWYSDRVGGFFALQAWSKAGPRELLDKFGEALRASDAAAIARMSAGPVECGRDEDGRFTVKLATGPTKGPPRPADAVTPGVPAAEAALRYDLANAEVTAQLPSVANGHVTYVLVRQGGAWKVKMALPSGPPGGR
jgi:hypothetical protein